MEFRILGPLEVRADGRAVALPGPKPRAVLAVLLMHANHSVSSEQLAFALWGEEAPAAAEEAPAAEDATDGPALDAGTEGDQDAEPKEVPDPGPEPDPEPGESAEPTE